MADTVFVVDATTLITVMLFMISVIGLLTGIMLKGKKRRPDRQDTRDALQREFRSIERETGRAARLATQRFLLNGDELSTRRRSS